MTKKMSLYLRNNGYPAAMVYVLYKRMKEIDGGEEDDLSNY